MQGHILSRLALTQHPEDDKTQPAEAAPQEAALAAVGSLQMTDVEAKQHSVESGAHNSVPSQHTDTVEGGKHAHQAQNGGKAHGRRMSTDNNNKSLWDDMLKRKVAADLERQKKSGIPNEASVTASEVAEQMSRANSTDALLTEGMGGSDRVADALATHSQQPSHQEPALEQPRAVSGKALLRVLSSGKRFLPSILKKTEVSDETAAKGGLTRHSGGGVVSRMVTAGSEDSNAQLLPAGMHSGDSALCGTRGLKFI